MPRASRTAWTRRPSQYVFAELVAEQERLAIQAEAALEAHDVAVVLASERAPDADRSLRGLVAPRYGTRLAATAPSSARCPRTTGRPDAAVTARPASARLPHISRAWPRAAASASRVSAAAQTSSLRSQQDPGRPRQPGGPGQPGQPAGSPGLRPPSMRWTRTYPGRRPAQPAREPRSTYTTRQAPSSQSLLDRGRVLQQSSRGCKSRPPSSVPGPTDAASRSAP